MEKNDDLEVEDTFYIPIMNLSDIQDTVGFEINTLDFLDIFQKFLQEIYKNPKEWRDEKEEKILKYITDFLSQNIFTDFVNHTIMAFLQKKYHTLVPEELVNCIYKNYIQKIAMEANLLFPMNETEFSIRNTETFSYFSIPMIGIEIISAVKKYIAIHSRPSDMININQSHQKDRIIMIRENIQILEKIESYKQEWKEYFKGIKEGKI